MPDQEAIDRAAIESLQALAGEGEESTLLTEVLTAFFNSSPPLLEAMRESSRKNDPRGLREAAHSLKSSSALVGAKRLSETCRQIETSQTINADTYAKVAAAQLQYETAVKELREIVSQGNSGVA